MIAIEKFGRLTPLRKLKRNRTAWECQCDCGNLVIVQQDHLRSGNTKSCGCLVRETMRAKQFKHGCAVKITPEYRTWKHIKNRCLNPSAHNFKYYGAVGVTVCKRWKNSFESFLSDMGQKPSSSHSIDRKNPNGNYTPSNCRWATKFEQIHNRRK